ncbi:sugar transporter domain-containing protein [Sarocladium implicatum]|nr:sugar transporter domain-containing protein [Sarocladium implicatum]
MATKAQDGAHIEHNHVEGKGALDHDDLVQAQVAMDEERHATFLQSVKLYPAAIGWSILLSTAIIMEGYDMKLIGSLNAQPAFTRKYGEEISTGTYEIPAPWQAGLANGATIGSLIGLALNGHVSERIGFKKTMLASLALMNGTILIPFFAPNVKVLLVGQIMQGIPWGIFQTLTTAYAAEVCPVHLRGYLTTYVNLCWVFGQFMSAGVLRAMAERTDEWAYRIPFALQWIWPVPLIVAISFAPESPWWCVRKDRIDDARKNLQRLARSGTDIDRAVTLMQVTVNQEREAGTGSRYRDCFRGVNMRRTAIACCTWAIQIMSGTGLRVYSTYFYRQAGLPSTQAFNMSLIQYALGIVGVFIAWFMLPYFGRRTLYIWGLVGLEVCLLTIGGLGVASAETEIAWAIGSMLILYTLVYDITVGPICYAIVSEVPASELRSKTIVLSRMTYNLLNIVSNTITPYMLNPGAWGWGAKTGFFFAGTCALSLVFTAFQIPETRGRTYAELNTLFADRTKAWEFADKEVNIVGSETAEEDRLKIGGTGHIGGAVLHKLLHKHPVEESLDVQVLVRSEEKSARLVAKYPQVQTVVGSFGSYDLLEDICSKVDVVINTAPDITHDDDIRAILCGMTRGSTKEPYYIHASGGSLVWDEPLGSEDARLWDDVADIADIVALRDTGYTHAVTDSIVRSAASNVNVAIISPGFVGGLSSSIEHPLPITTPAFMTTARAFDSGFQIAEGKNQLGWIHVSDLADMFQVLVDDALAALTGRPIQRASGPRLWGTEAYYFGVSTNIPFNDFMSDLASALHEQAVITSPEIRSVDVNEAAQISLAGPGRVYDPQAEPPAPDSWAMHIAIGYGVNMRIEATRMRELGWEPKMGRIASTFPDVVREFLRREREEE